MENILILSISIMFAAIAALIFAFAYILVQIKLPKVETQELKKRELSSEEIRKARRMQKETINMLTYNGDPQEEVTDD